MEERTKSSRSAGVRLCRCLGKYAKERRAKHTQHNVDRHAQCVSRQLAEDKTQGIKPIRAIGEATLILVTGGLSFLASFFNDHPDYAVYTLLHLLAIDASQLEESRREKLLNSDFEKIRQYVKDKCRKAVQTFLSGNSIKAVEGAIHESSSLQAFDKVYEAAQAGEKVFELPAFVQDSNVFYYWSRVSPAYQSGDVTIEWNAATLRLNAPWWPKPWQYDGAI